MIKAIKNKKNICFSSEKVIPLPRIINLDKNG